jgi:hypothetical protein
MGQTKKKSRRRKLGKLRISKGLRDFLPPVSRISVIMPPNWQITAVEKKTSTPANSDVRRSQ